MEAWEESEPFFGTGTTDATFQLEGNSPTETHLLKSLAKTGASSGESCLKTMTGMPWVPLDLELSRQLMIRRTAFTVMVGGLSFSPVRGGNGGGLS